MCTWGDGIFLQAWISSRAARAEALTHYCEVEAGGASPRARLWVGTFPGISHSW